MVRRNDMDNFENVFKPFEISKDFNLKINVQLPYPSYTFSYFEKELEPYIEQFVPSYDLGLITTGI